MRMSEIRLRIPAPRTGAPWEEVRGSITSQLRDGVWPIRFAVVASTREAWECEIGVIEDIDLLRGAAIQPIFDLRRRAAEDTREFTAVLLVPTGIGSEIGGHAGDAMPVAALAASVVDTLVLHPNVVNGSDIMELPSNALYVEGSVIARLLAGTVALRPVRSNRVLTVLDEHEIRRYTDDAINTVSAARVSFGMDASDVYPLDPRVRLTSSYTKSGRAVGEVSELDGLLELLDRHRADYDAVALSTQISVPFNYHLDYYTAQGSMVNPWGGVEAILTHALSSLYDVPTAHAPMLESPAVENIEVGVVDPRMAAEAISTSFFTCVMKGLHRSPAVVRLQGAAPAGAVAAEQVSCLVIPDKVIGLPVLAALEQGIPVIAVRENKNILDNDLAQLPWRHNQLFVVDNYWEAVGVMAALRTGIEPVVVRRPISPTREIAPASRAARTGAAAATDGAPARDGQVRTPS